MEITKAAIRLGDKIYTGFDHGECFKKIPEERHGLTVEQGFINSDNEFVDRKQAMEIARAANQLTYDDGNRKTLISEDLHLYWLNKLSDNLYDEQCNGEKLATAMIKFRERCVNLMEIIKIGVNTLKQHINDSQAACCANIQDAKSQNTYQNELILKLDEILNQAWKTFRGVNNETKNIF